jgi:hypothetical protein
VRGYGVRRLRFYVAKHSLEDANGSKNRQE